ncbi:MAG: hypothetical protein LBB26_01465 [Puniceicoccales bacterium]|jgi:hypothetical protein|nr:hypothetical protein [Puniceicoccales bacterium]
MDGLSITQPNLSIGASVWKSLVRLLALVGIVITWPLSLPAHGPLQLLALATKSPRIIKFNANYWHIISLGFLRQTSTKQEPPAPKLEPPAPKPEPPAEKAKLSIGGNPVYP